MAFFSSRPAIGPDVRRRIGSNAAAGRDRSHAQRSEHGEDPPFEASRWRMSDWSHDGEAMFPERAPLTGRLRPVRGVEAPTNKIAIPDSSRVLPVGLSDCHVRDRDQKGEDNAAGFVERSKSAD